MATAIIIQANDKQHERARATKSKRRKETWTKSKKDKETSAEEQATIYKRKLHSKKERPIHIQI